MPLNENMKPSSEAAELVKNIQDILKIPAVRKSVIQNKPIEKPHGWKSSSNPPYFKERFALEFKLALDKMMESGEDMEYRYADFKMTKDSMYLRVAQSRMYLLERLDPEGKYAKFLEQITITRERTGVRLSFCRDIRVRRQGDEPDFFPSVIDAIGQASLRNKIVDWLEVSKSGDIFDLDKLSLPADEVNELQILLAPLENVAAEITATRVRLIRL